MKLIQNSIPLKEIAYPTNKKANCHPIDNESLSSEIRFCELFDHALYLNRQAICVILTVILEQYRDFYSTKPSLLDQLSALLTLLEKNQQTYLEHDMVVYIAFQLEMISKKINFELKKICKYVSIQLYSIWIQNQRELDYKRYEKKHQYLLSNGFEEITECKVKLSTGVGLLPNENSPLSLKTSAHIGYKYGLSSIPDRIILDNKEASTSLSTRLFSGFKLSQILQLGASVKGQIAGFSSKPNGFNSIQDFYRHVGYQKVRLENDIIKQSCFFKKHGVFQGYQALDKIVQKSINTRFFIMDWLSLKAPFSTIKHTTIDMNGAIHYFPPILSAKITGKSCSITGGFSAELNLPINVSQNLHLGGRISATYERSKLGILVNFRKNLHEIITYQPEYLNSIPHDLLNVINDKISTQQGDLNHRLFHYMLEIIDIIDNYHAILCRYDNMKSDFYVDKKALAEKKHAIEKDFFATGRIHLILQMYYVFCYIHYIYYHYQKIDLIYSDPQLENKLQQLLTLIRQPNSMISYEKLYQKTTLPNKMSIDIKQNTFILNLSLPFISGSVHIAFAEKKSKVHFFSGDILSIKFSGKVNIAGNHISMLELNRLLNDKILDVADIDGFTLPDNFNFFSEIDLCNMTLFKEIVYYRNNFFKIHDYKYQNKYRHYYTLYKRVFNFTVGVPVPIPILPLVNVSLAGQVQWRNQKEIKEIFGHETLSYFIFIYTTLAVVKEKGFDWQNFIVVHTEELVQVMLKLADEQSMLHEEMLFLVQHMFSQLKCDVTLTVKEKYDYILTKVRHQNNEMMLDLFEHLMQKSNFDVSVFQRLLVEQFNTATQRFLLDYIDDQDRLTDDAHLSFNHVMNLLSILFSVYVV